MRSSSVVVAVVLAVFMPRFPALRTCRGAVPEGDLKLTIEVVKDKDERVEYRRRACQFLAHWSEESAPAIPALLDALEDERIAFWAADALWHIGPAARQAAAKRQATLKADSDASRMAALAASAHAEPLQRLIAILDGTDAAAQSWAIRTCARVASAVPSHRAGIASALQRLGSRAGVLPAVRVAAVFAFVPVSGDVQESVLLLSRLVIDEDTSGVDRGRALQKLGEMGVAAKSAEMAITASLYRGDDPIRRKAAWALGEICVSGDSAVPALNGLAAAAAEKGRSDVYEAAVEAARKIEQREDEARRAALADAMMQQVNAEAARRRDQLHQQMLDMRREQAQSWAKTFRNPYQNTAEDDLRVSDWYKGLSESHAKAAAGYGGIGDKYSQSQAKDYAARAASEARQAEEYRKRAAAAAEEIRRKAQ